MGRNGKSSAGAGRVAALVRQRIEAGGERLWRLEDFRDLLFAAVAQALSRLTREGLLERLSKGIYYHGRPTAFGKSLPNPAAMQKLAAGRKTVFPSGIAAANLLGFTTQTARRSEVSTSALSLPRKLVGSDTLIHTRRPEAWTALSEADAALLDFLRRLRDIVGAHPALTFLPAESRTIGGFGRNDRFAYAQRFGGPGEVANRVLLEAGTASGREPTVVIELTSYLGQFLRERGVPLGAEDEGAFTLPLLHFRRTFVEKMFAIHGKVELLKRDQQPLGTYARHYYDLFQLAAEAEVLAMLRSTEYAAIKADYDLVSRTHFARSYFAPMR